jgi:DNA-binding response OmpR family regulator/tetratricopeptide (TPR) repeat protein
MSSRILLAEDNANLSGLLQKFLTGQGFAVTPAATGPEALQRFASAEFDLLVLDLRLPGLPGPELLAKIRKTPKGGSLPVVVMTGVYRGEKFVEGARRLGVRHYLEKPFRPADFLAAVRDALTPPPQQTTFGSVLDIHNRGRSGTLRLPGRSPVVFLQGEPVSFNSRGESDFPSFLAGRGRISAEDARIVRESGEARIFLTETGLLTFDDLCEESRLFLIGHLREIMAESSGAEFREETPEIEAPLVPLSLPRLLYEQKIGLAAFDPAEFEESRLTLCPGRTLLFYRRANLMTLRTEEIDLLDRVNGERNLSEILEDSHDRREAGSFLSLLLRLGMIEFMPERRKEPEPDFVQRNLFNRPLKEEIPLEHFPAVDFGDIVEEVSASVEAAVGEAKMAAPLSQNEIGFEQAVLRDHAFIKDKNYYEIFGLTQNSFSFEALKEAYFARSRQYTPERFMELSGQTAAYAEEILATYGNAFNTLSNVIAKERYDELLNADTVGLDGKQDSELQTQVQLQSGKVFLEMGEYENAAKVLQDAYTLMPDNPEHCSFLAWAIYRNPANRNSRASLERARGLLSRSIQMGKTAEAYAFRGWMLLDEGRDGLAEGEFQKALRLNPGEPNAHKGMRQITEKREAEKKGLFRKIFG